MVNQYVYPAQFIKEDNDTFSVYFPDLKGCQTYDDTLEGAVIMAKKALEGFIEVLLEEGEKLPSPSMLKDVSANCEYAMMIVADNVNAPHFVEKILRVPMHLDIAATMAKLDMSRILEDALVKNLSIDPEFLKNSTQLV